MHRENTWIKSYDHLKWTLFFFFFLAIFTFQKSRHFVYIRSRVINKLNPEPISYRLFNNETYKGLNWDLYNRNPNRFQFFQIDFDLPIILDLWISITLMDPNDRLLFSFNNHDHRFCFKWRIPQGLRTVLFRHSVTEDFHQGFRMVLLQNDGEAVVSSLWAGQSIMKYDIDCWK